MYLLPRTRRPATGRLLAGRDGADGRAGPRGRLAAGRRADPGGTGLLAAATTAGMLAVSALSGLGAPAWTVAVLAAVAVTAGAALLRHERRAAAPLLDLRALAAAGTGPALLGALCAYLVLFGPLVLFPQVISARGGSAAAAGLLLTALPAGFGLAAVAADRLLPARWPNRRRCLLGGALAGRLRGRAGGTRSRCGISGAARPARRRPWHLHSGQQRRDHGRGLRHGTRRRQAGW